MQRILAIWLPNWPIQRLTHDKPALEQRPVILQHRTRRGLCVLACSRAARQQGVHVDLPVAEATAVWRRAGHTDSTETRPTDAGSSNRASSKGASSKGSTFHLETHDPVEDRVALVKLASWCHRFSPLVGLEESTMPDTLLLNVTGVTPLFGSESAFVAQVTRSFQQQRLGVRLGLSDTIGAAWALAHFGQGSHLEPDPVEASCAGPHSTGPNSTGPHSTGPHCAGPPDNAVPGLPLAALRLPEETVDILERLGLQQIGQLLELPRGELESRFGPQLLRRLDQTFGRVTELIQPVQPPLEFTAEWLFEYPVPQRQAVQEVVHQLVERLCVTLADHARGVLRLCGRIVCQDAADVTWEIGLFRPSADTEHIWRLVETQLERLPLPGPATRVALCTSQHARLHTRQQELFEQRERKADSPQIATLVDCLASQLGRTAVVRCVLQRDAQPERAFRDVPLVGDRMKRRPTRARPSTFGLLDRPLRLLDPPHLLQALVVAPAGPPLSFCYLNNRHEVARYWGPERIETGWWRQRGIRRDYYRVETAEGRRFWLFRGLDEGRWRLHGVFE